MTRVTISHNADAMAALLDAVGRRQMPFALATGINRMIDEIQVDARRKLPSQFTFRSARSRRFFETLIHIGREDRARKDKLVGTVGIQDPFGKAFKGKSRLLAQYQEAGTKQSRDGVPIAIPVSTAFPRSQPIPQRYYPTTLGLNPRRRIEGGTALTGLRRTAKGKAVFRGKQRTYAVDPFYHTAAPFSTWGVWQRRGRGREREIFLLWVYRKQTRRPKRISFPEDATALTRDRLALNIEGQMQAARNEIKQYRARLFERVARTQGRL